MVRRFLVIGVVLAAVLLFSVDAAFANRLGGAYRGPWGDEVKTPEEETSTDVGGETSGNEPTADTGGSDSGGDSGGGSSSDGAIGGDGDGGGDGDSGGDTGGGDDAGTGGGDDGSGDGSAAPPPDGSTDGGGDSGGDSGGGSTGPSSPSNPGGGGSSGGGVTPGGGNANKPGGNKAVIDQKAFWSFWFEHNKEWILAELLRAKAARGSVAQGSSGWYFSGATAGRILTPVTDEQKTEVILPLLKKASMHPSSWVRDAAVLAMGKLGDDKVIPYLIQRYQVDPDPQVKEDALLALGLTGAQKTAFLQLMKVLQKKPAQGNQKAYAALGLALLGNPAAVSPLMKEYKVALKSRNDDLASVLAIAIGSFGDDAVVAELARPIKSRGREILKVHVCQALGRISGDASRDMLLRAVGDKKEEVKAAAVLALSRFPDAKVVNALRGKGGLGDGRNQVKAFAAVALGRIGRDLPDSEKKLKKLIAKDLRETAEGPQKNIYAAMYAALGLAIMGDESANKFFEKHIVKKGRKFRDEVHSAIAMAAGLLPMPEAAPELRDIAKGGVDQDFQGYACFALGIMGDTKSKAGILKVLKRESRRKDVLRSGAWAIGLLGDETDLPMLIEMLKIENKAMHQVRGAAAIAIGLIGDGSAVDPLVEMATNDPVGANRAFAIAALGCLIDKDPVPRMPQLFENIHYRKRCKVVEDAMQNL